MALSVVRLGLVGIPDEGRRAGIDALKRQRRLCLSEVFDPCLASAEAEAQQHDCSVSASLDGLLRRIDGVVIADVKWMQAEPIIRALGLQRPALLLAPVLAQLSPDDLLRIQHFSHLTRTLVTPEFALRWARSTLRLRELTATRLGAVEKMELTCRGDLHHPSCLLIVDWCGNAIQSDFRSVKSNPQGSEVLIQFRRINRQEHPVSARISFDPSSTPETFPLVDARITCRHGEVRISGEQTLEWQIDRRVIMESLTGDRSGCDVMFDLFGRRLVGGIVPVPDIRDVIRAHHVCEAMRTSRTLGTLIALERTDAASGEYHLPD